MKRILFVSWYTGLGGGETDLLALRDSLDGREYETHLLLPAPGPLGERWDGAVHIIPYRGATTLFAPGLWARFPVVRRFADLLRREGIDLAHCDYHSLPMIAPAAARVGLPVVFNLWGWWFKPKPWQRAFFRGIPATIARSKAIRDGFLGEPPFMPAARAPIIYPGVDANRFSPDVARGDLRAEIGIPSDAPLVVMAARFQRVKGHHTFQAMARQILRQMPEARFVVAGDALFGVAADSRYRDEILRVAKTDPLLRDRLHYIGFRSDIESVYAAADVVVCASAFESLGIAIIEAMACGKAVVSGRRGGPSETIAHGETGLLVDAEDVRALARAVCRLLQDADLRREMGARARDHAVKRFSIDAMSKAHEAVFEALLRLS